MECKRQAVESNAETVATSALTPRKGANHGEGMQRMLPKRKRAALQVANTLKLRRSGERAKSAKTSA